MKTPPTQAAEDPRRTVPINTRVSAEMYRWLQGEQGKHFVETGSKLPISGVVKMLLERVRANPNLLRRVK